MEAINYLSPTAQMILFSALKIAGVFSVLMFVVAYSVMIERKVSAFIQDRHGPNRVGPWGLLQPLADAVKAFLKEAAREDVRCFRLYDADLPRVPHRRPAHRPARCSRTPSSSCRTSR